MARLSGQEADDAASLRSEMERMQRRLDECREMYMNEEITRADYVHMTGRLRAECDEVEKKIASVGLDDSLQRLLQVKDLRAHWHDELDVDRRFAVVSTFFTRIVIHPRGKVSTGVMKAGDVEFWLNGYDEPVH